MTLAIVATSIRFSQTMYSKAENEGPIEIKLVLNNTLPDDVTVQVISNDNTATGRYTSIISMHVLLTVMII